MKARIFISIQENEINKQLLSYELKRYAETLLLNIKMYVGRNIISEIINEQNQFLCIDVEKLDNMSYNEFHNCIMRMEKEMGQIKMLGYTINIKFFTQEIF